MKKTLLTFATGALATVALAPLAMAQPFQWPENYAPTAIQGGNIDESIFSDFTTFNFILSSSATEVSILGLVSNPDLVYRDINHSEPQSTQPLSVF